MKKVLRLLVILIMIVPSFSVTAGIAVEEATAEASVLEGESYQHFYFPPTSFKSYGSWTLNGELLLGRVTATTPDEADGSGGEPAISEVNITKSASYRLWVRDRDFATNQPGTRSFHVSVDGVMADEKFGDHGQEGFRWSEVGIYELDEGIHELALVDTSGFYARSEGFFLTENLDLIPPEDKEQLLEIVQPTNPLNSLPSAAFPAWAKADVTPVRTESIENESVKVVFHQGAGEQADLVQNEIYVKDGAGWALVKGKTEELGFLMMSALHSELAGESKQFSLVKQTVGFDGRVISAVTGDYFKSGVPVWFIPSDFQKVDDNRIELTFPNTEADLKVTFELDELTDDPKVTLQAVFPEQGAYSFMLFSGDGVSYEDYDTVTAPLLYVKKVVPDDASMIAESYLFTPMATLHYKENQSKVQGKPLTSGVVMDPSSVPQGFSYTDTSRFGLVLRDPDLKVRPQLIAPMFGTEHSLFEGGDHYEVSYRIINRLNSWYDTLTHVSEHLYNMKDLRTNYFHSINETIYNATDLMLDDDYGGWDPVNMAHYNMEERDLTTLANSMTALQRYLLTENEEILDERAIPTLAFMLSKKNFHYKITDSVGGAKYVPELPTPMGGPVEKYSASVFGGLYEMTQGRMPFLLDTAIDFAKESANLNGVVDQAAMYKYTGDETYLSKVKQLADRYLDSNPNAGENRESRFITGFVFGDYIPMVTTFLAAYEATGEAKYLDAAEEAGQLLVTGLWTTGYHNGYAESEYTMDPVETSERPLVADQFNFWWHGDQQWRLGNPDGEAKPPQESGPALQEETAPGWLIAKAGMGTEHPYTPGTGNIITMNNWAGMLIKLSEYTGDPYFETMARNAMIGRFGNYPGYYQDRPIFHQMRADYPYKGPDYTSIYFHHIPVFISMLEDFLINSAWSKSERNITFPSIYQSGYAYFASNQFGHAPGRFYDEEDMWLWLDRGIIEPDSVEIDYIAARKDGVLGLALMNEGNESVTTTIALGEKVEGGATYSGTATVYEADGTISQIAVQDGRFDIDIPAKGIRSVVLRISGVKTPAYVKTDYVYSNNKRDTVTEHTRGKGHIIQVSPESYHAYVYISDMNDTTSKLTMAYRIGDEQHTVEKTGYPYEFLIKVDDPTKPFSYELQAVKTDGQTVNLGGGTLAPNDFDEAGITLPATVDKFEPFELTVSTKGMSASEGVLRWVVPVDDFPFPVKENLLVGLRITGTLTHKTDGSTLQLNSIIKRNEVRTDGTAVLVIYPDGAVPLADYKDYNVAVTIHPPEPLSMFNPFDVTVNYPGMNATEGVIRLVVPVSPFPFPIRENTLSGLRVTGTLTHKVNGSPLILDSTIVRNEARSDGTAVLVVSPTAEVPLMDYKDYNIALTIYPADSIPPETAIDFVPSEGEETNGWYSSAVTVTLLPSDKETSVTETVYRLNGGAWTSYSGSIVISSDGAHTLEYYSTDRVGNAESPQSASIRIDRIAPELSLEANPATIWPPNNKMVPVQVNVNTVDHESGIASVKLMSITCNEPIGEGDVQDAEFGTDDREFSLRASRLGTGDGRPYTITYIATDTAGNSTTASVEVLVLHNM